MTVRVDAIVPTKKLSTAAVLAELNRSLKAFATDVKKEMSEYPSARPWQSRTPKSGPRAGGKRTGRYGRGWHNAEVEFTPYSVTIVNPVPYASAVGGSRSRSPGQAHRLAARGWKSISDVGPGVAKRHLPDFSHVVG